MNQIKVNRGIFARLLAVMALALAFVGLSSPALAVPPDISDATDDMVAAVGTYATPVLSVVAAVVLVILAIKFMKRAAA